MRARLFTPFCTTKSAGSGLGLPICRTIAEAHDGELGFHDNEPHGAVFRMSLPIPPEHIT
jgi:signal transduction histidine kinase